MDIPYFEPLISPQSMDDTDIQSPVSVETPTEVLLSSYLYPQLSSIFELDWCDKNTSDGQSAILFDNDPLACGMAPSVPHTTETPTNNNDHIRLELNSFNDLQTALSNLAHPIFADRRHPLQPSAAVGATAAIATHPTHATQSGNQQHKQHKQRRQRKKSLKNNVLRQFYNVSYSNLPASVRLDAESSCMLESLMNKAVSHWCCIGFKVAPISLEMIRNWRHAPLAIVYCVASISLVTFMDHSAGQSFVKDAAIVFYQQASHKMDDVFLEDMQPIFIQAYFCLSYTSNLLRLYEQQRTWGSLASIALRNQAKKLLQGQTMDDMTRLCWYRWYYVDSWMCLTLHRECLLPDDAPLIDQETHLVNKCSSMYHFAVLSRFMRRYIRATQSGKIFDSNRPTWPSTLYYIITNELKAWYQQLVFEDTDDIMCVHFQICYNAMRLVVLHSFLHPQSSPPYAILIDCLEINLALLQSLQYLKDVGCDQSTYHHMFLAIHNAAKRIYSYSQDASCAALRPFARDQLRINLMLLRGTRAYANDVFQVRDYAEKIEEQFLSLGIPLDQWHDECCDSTASHIMGEHSLHPHCQHHRTASNTRNTKNTTTSMSAHHSLSSGMFVFRTKPMRFPAKRSKGHSGHTVQFDQSITV